MTIIFEGSGDIFESEMQTLVNPCNAVGAMGKGLAKQFKIRYPKYYEAYRLACMRRVFRTEKCFVYDLDEEHKVYSMLTKWHWKFPSQLSWIDSSVQRLAEHYRDYGITSVAIPAVGCGEGGLDWLSVQEVLHKYLGPSELIVEIYAPF